MEKRRLCFAYTQSKVCWEYEDRVKAFVDSSLKIQLCQPDVGERIYGCFHVQVTLDLEMLDKGSYWRYIPVLENGRISFSGGQLLSVKCCVTEGVLLGGFVWL